MSKLSRRTVVTRTMVTSLSAVAAGDMLLEMPAMAAGTKMTLALHQNTSANAGYQKSLEGWGRAGVKNVEITNGLIDEFLKTNDLAAAKRVITDNGLKLVSAACGVTGLWEPAENRAAILDATKKRFEMFASLGLDKMYSTTASTRKPAADDYNAAPDRMREVGEIAKQYKMILMVEAPRNSSFISNISTLTKLTRQAAHPNLKMLFDFYHFWSWQGKLEDLDAVKPGEIAHVHFQDVPDMPRELLDSTTRAIPGDGVSPLKSILQKLSEKGYAGALSVELFLPKYQQTDPYEMAREIKQKAEGVMKLAKVL